MAGKRRPLFIGEAPAFMKTSRAPFVGQPGILNELLASIGLKREDVYITNIIKTRPPGNRDPLPVELPTASRGWTPNWIIRPG
jgi:DNA polymerase